MFPTVLGSDTRRTDRHYLHIRRSFFILQRTSNKRQKSQPGKDSKLGPFQIHSVQTIQYSTTQYNTIQCNTQRSNYWPVPCIWIPSLPFSWRQIMSLYKVRQAASFDGQLPCKQEYQLSRWIRYDAGKRLRTCISLGRKKHGNGG